MLGLCPWPGTVNAGNATHDSASHNMARDLLIVFIHPSSTARCPICHAAAPRLQRLPRAPLTCQGRSHVSPALRALWPSRLSFVSSLLRLLRLLRFLGVFLSTISAYPGRHSRPMARSWRAAFAHGGVQMQHVGQSKLPLSLTTLQIFENKCRTRGSDNRGL